MGVQIIRTESDEELVVLPRRQYIALLARAGDEAAEDEMTRILGEEFKAALARGEEVALPEQVWAAIEAGESPVKVLRKRRGLTQAELAAAAGVSKGYVAELEALARALGVPLDVLVE